MIIIIIIIKARTWQQKAVELVKEMGRRTKSVTGDERERRSTCFSSCLRNTAHGNTTRSLSCRDRCGLLTSPTQRLVVLSHSYLLISTAAFVIAVFDVFQNNNN